MKELDQFTVERLTELSARENLPELAALARIALAAKQAEPVAYLTWHQGCRSPDDCEDYINAYTHKTEEKSCDGNDAFPVYDVPVLNSPEAPDGWVACAERMPREGDFVIVAPDGGVTQCVTYFWEDCPINGRPMWFTHSEECEPVPLAEFTHWQPLPAAPKPEK